MSPTPQVDTSHLTVYNREAPTEQAQSVIGGAPQCQWQLVAVYTAAYPAAG